tara:strand:- start:1809 stop:4610 length:2802 start_codon:yes stop_codon:yes gene_type:complete
MKDYKETLNLPKTSFPMKANLPNKEPEILKFWEEIGLYKKIRQQQKDKKPFILLDGPPYANGKIHIGHALNKILKDIIIKSKTLSDFDAPYIPGWDCHGLPIEHQVEKKKGKVGAKLEAKEFREFCKSYAIKQVEEQREDFIRLGVLGEWGKPYLTLDKDYESEQINAFAKIINNNHVIYGHKPVHWCLDCKSALAEAEVEYQDKESLSVDVAFRVIDNEEFINRSGLKSLKPEIKTIIPIWTTTPWTLPSNEAVVLGENIDYSIFETSLNNENIICLIATELLDTNLERWGIELIGKPKKIDPSVLEGLILEHPIYEKEVPILIGDYVTTENGTGAVHTAPAHGQDDFLIGKKNDLDLECYVNSYGVFEDEKEFFSGQHIFKSEQMILEKIEERKNLIHQEKFVHSYPHCWRHKSPLIFRTTRQWFISMENESFRENCLNAIGKVKWFPEWGEERIFGMVSTRPDWCISRQRYWGVPIPLFINKEDRTLHPKTNEIMESIANDIKNHGIEKWFDSSVKDYLGKDYEDYEKSSDTMDVWMDSGLAHHSVSQSHKEITFPADLYLEGSDQHRGWFQSSLLTSVAMNGSAPYKQVLTHGFFVDEHGKKMSKSLGNVIAPQNIINSMGADILRLWVASTDYTSEMRISDEILKRNSDTYRRIRNTARFLLSNLGDFNPAEEMIAYDKLLVLDQWVIDRLSNVNEQIKDDFERYSFHKVSQTLHNFCVNDMGGFYLDVIKDRLYTMPENSIGRRSAQTVLMHIAESLVRWIAPMLSFTSEEIWQLMPGKREPSVFLSNWHEFSSSNSQEEWGIVQDLNEAVAKSLEVARDKGVIGSSLDADLTLYADEKLISFLKPFSKELRFLFITSNLSILPLNDAKKNTFHAKNYAISVDKSEFDKCNRCWHRQESVGESKDHPELCSRCENNISSQSEQRLFF